MGSIFLCQPSRSSQDAPSSPPPPPPAATAPVQQQASQPVEFNHAINYVNKIKVSQILWFMAIVFMLVSSCSTQIFADYFMIDFTVFTIILKSCISV